MARCWNARCGQIFLFAAVGAVVWTGPAWGGEPLVVHEWGTFTVLQDETGAALPGVNTDDEALPEFVHRLSSELVVGPSDLAPAYSKGVPAIHREVTMRLETPVVYFHPPKGSGPLKVDVRVGFRGGWLSEYYPSARADVPGVREGGFEAGRITPDVEGSLRWTGLTVGGGATPPETDARVWLAPRKVESAPVRSADGESERYLFYRGVAHREAPLKVMREEGRDVLTVIDRFDPTLFAEGDTRATTLWLVHVREDGAVAFRRLGPLAIGGERDGVIARTPAAFAEGEFAVENLDRLRDEMHAALVGDGLFADEATAMLATWEAGYFRSPGERLFFLLPRAWTDAVLPIEVSAPAEITRTMVGRVELVTPRHRELLLRLSTLPVGDLGWFFRAVGDGDDSQRTYADLWSGKLRLSQTAIKPPEDYKTYLALGRFRNALVLDAAGREGWEGLAGFVETYGLRYFTPDE